MFQYDKLLDALKLPLKATIGAALATGTVLALDQFGVLNLDAFGTSLIRPIVLIAFVCFAVLAAVGVADFALAPWRDNRKQTMLANRRATRRREQDALEVEAKKRALTNLDHLSDQEIHYVADCLRRGSPTFYTWVHSSGASMLLGKRLVWTPGDVHHQDHYPYSFFDFAWEEIQSRRDEFLAKDEELNGPKKRSR